MSSTPFMPLWVADFVGDTLDLDAKEIGAYMLILMTMWGRDGYLPNDEKKLQRVARCGRDWPRVWGAIGHYFTVEGDQITQLRLRLELQKVAAKREVNAQSGARGGHAKALKDKEAALANATVSPQQPEPYLEPYKKEQKEEGKPSSKKSIGERLSGEWFLPMEWGEWAVNEGLSINQIRAQADTFKDYWIAQPGAKGRKTDWQATWRNWIRKSRERENGNGYSKASGAANSDAAARQIAIAARFARSPGVNDF